MCPHNVLDEHRGEGEACIVSVVTSGGLAQYEAGMRRLKRKLQEVGYQGSWQLWTGYPPHSPSHEECPYGFKLFAIQHALTSGYSQVIWLDAEAFPIRPLNGALSELASVGVVSISGNDKLGKWCSDDALVKLGLTREDAFAQDMWLQMGKVYGIDIATLRGRTFFGLWMQALQAGVFNGYAINSAVNTDKAEAAIGRRPTGFVSHDSRVWGHRHDEIAAGYLVWRLGIPCGKVGHHWYARWAPRLAQEKPGVYFAGCDGLMEIPRESADDTPSGHVR